MNFDCIQWNVVSIAWDKNSVRGLRISFVLVNSLWNCSAILAFLSFFGAALYPFSTAMWRVFWNHTSLSKSTSFNVANKHQYISVHKALKCGDTCHMYCGIFKSWGGAFLFFTVL